MSRRSDAVAVSRYRAALGAWGEAVTPYLAQPQGMRARSPRGSRSVPNIRREFGSRGEDHALAYMEGLALRLVARNQRTSFGEVDLIVSDEQVLVFAEVKARHARAGYRQVFNSELGWPSAKQRIRLRAAARSWLVGAPPNCPRPPEIRFDALRLLFDETETLVDLTHIEGI